MSFEIRLSDESQIDLKDAVDYYEEVSQSLRDEFLSEIFETMDLMAEQPLLYQLRYRTIRIAFTKKFNFGIHFILEGSTISVLRILHTSRFFK